MTSDDIDTEAARIEAALTRGTAGMELSEKEAYGHLQHALGNARDAARRCFGDFTGLPIFINSLKSAHSAMRSLGILRSEEQWIVAARPLQQLIDMAMANGRPTSSDMRWLEIAARLDRVTHVVKRMFEAARTDGVQVAAFAH